MKRMISIAAFLVVHPLETAGSPERLPCGGLYVCRTHPAFSLGRTTHFLQVAALALAGLITACGPTITVENKTRFPVRVVVTSGGKSEMLSPSPGESSSADATEGAYRVSVIPDAEWIAYAKLTRAYLNDQLANADKLTGPQLLDVIRRLKDIAEQMQRYELAAGSSSGCSGRVTEDGGGLVQVSTAPDGKLVVTCR